MEVTIAHSQLVENRVIQNPGRFREFANESLVNSDAEIESNAQRAPSSDALVGMIGESEEMQKVFSRIKKIGASDISTLVTGESGTGKEMVACALHRVSDRSANSFVAINCAAIPNELLESELFGHAKGAFTGAISNRRGLFEEANGGTVFLDEIGDLSLPMQAKILRLIQTRQVKPVGQNSNKEVNVRIVSATHKNLKVLVKKGEFREDLYFRLNVMPILLPALRDRGNDVIILAKFFVDRAKAKRKIKSFYLSPGAIDRLRSHSWPGNVRELENVIERAVVLSNGEVITENDILLDEMEQVESKSEDIFNLGLSLKGLERAYINHVLNRTGSRKMAAVRILGIDRKTLYRKEREYLSEASANLN